MAIRELVTRGYGNGTFNGTIAFVATRGYVAGDEVEVATTRGGYVPPPLQVFEDWRPQERAQIAAVEQQIAQAEAALATTPELDFDLIANEIDRQLAIQLRVAEESRLAALRRRRELLLLILQLEVDAMRVLLMAA